MKTTVVVRFKRFFLFTILLITILQLAEAVPEKKTLKDDALHAGK